MSTNTIHAVVSELTSGTLQLEPAHWVHVPLDESHELRLLQIDRGASIVAVIARTMAQFTPSEVDALHDALLKLGAETCWTEGFCGGLDEDGSACIGVTLTGPGPSRQIEDVLDRMLERFTAICEAAIGSTAGFRSGAGAPVGQPSSTWGLP